MDVTTNFARVAGLMLGYQLWRTVSWDRAVQTLREAPKADKLPILIGVAEGLLLRIRQRGAARRRP